VQRAWIRQRNESAQRVGEDARHGHANAAGE
jgi:hypothetical protein